MLFAIGHRVGSFGFELSGVMRSRHQNVRILW